MSQIFNVKRFTLLLKRQWYENAAIYKWGIVLMIAAVLLLFWLSSNWKTVENPHLGQMETFSIVGLSFFLLFGGNFFDSLRSKHKVMLYFSLPVSPLERVGVAVTSVMVFLPLLFLIIFSVSDFLFVQFFNHVHSTSEQMLFTKTSPFEHIRLSFVFVLAWSFSSLALANALGSTLGKNGIITRIITTVIIFFILSVFFLMRTNIYGSISVIEFLNSYIFLLIIPLCWGMMYFCMKRKEV